MHSQDFHRVKSVRITSRNLTNEHGKFTTTHLHLTHAATGHDIDGQATGSVFIETEIDLYTDTHEPLPLIDQRPTPRPLETAAAPGTLHSALGISDYGDGGNMSDFLRGLAGSLSDGTGNKDDHGYARAEALRAMADALDND